MPRAAGEQACKERVRRRLPRGEGAGRDGIISLAVFLLLGRP